MYPHLRVHEYTIHFLGIVLSAARHLKRSAIYKRIYAPLASAERVPEGGSVQRGSTFAMPPAAAAYLRGREDFLSGGRNELALPRVARTPC